VSTVSVTASGAGATTASATATAATTLSPTVRPAASAVASAPPATAGAATVPSSPSVAGPSSSSSDDALPPGTTIPAGYGILQIGAPRGARVVVDGVEAGIGPLSSTIQRAGYHQVRVEQDGKRSQYVIEVRAGKTTRVKSSPLP